MIQFGADWHGGGVRHKGSGNTDGGPPGFADGLEAGVKEASNPAQLSFGLE